MLVVQHYGDYIATIASVWCVFPILIHFFSGAINLFLDHLTSKELRLNWNCMDLPRPGQNILPKFSSAFPNLSHLKVYNLNIECLFLFIKFVNLLEYCFIKAKAIMFLNRYSSTQKTESIMCTVGIRKNIAKLNAFCFYHIISRLDMRLLVFWWMFLVWKIK